LKIKKINITDINEADYNPRTISDDEMIKLENSITEFGFVDPMIINLKNNKLIGGHQRYNALLSLNMKKGNFAEELNLVELGDIGWVFPDMDLKIESEQHEKALNIALNKISGTWDNEKLFTLLEELEYDDMGIELTGFTDEEMEMLEKGVYNSDYEEDYFDNLEDIYEKPDDWKPKEYECPVCGGILTNDDLLED
jgi:ParB-like chromosome segregation protein Spo0J